MSTDQRRPEDDLARRVAWLEWRLQWAEWKIGQLEKHAGVAALPVEAAPTPHEAAREVAAALPPQPAPTDVIASPPSEGPSPAAATPAGAAPAAATPEPPTPPPAASFPAAAVAPAAPYAPPPRRPPAAPAFDLESLIGVRLFSWLGGAALFVGVALFLNYSIQQNLISPELRVALGLVFGAAALVGGDRVRAKADLAGQALAGAGVAILYASLFAAHSLYHLISSGVAFAGMALVTLTAGAMAVRRDAFMLAVLGLLGGFLTPYLVSTGEDRPLALFAYVALLDAGVIFVAARKRWSVLGLLGVAGSALIFTGWALRFLDSSKAPYALFAGALLAGLFAFTAPDGAKGEGGAAGARAPMIARITATVAAVLPLVLAVTVAGAHAFPVAPLILVVYLIVLSAGAWFAARRADVAPLMPVAAAFGALTLALRADHTLFPAQRIQTLAFFALLPAAWFALWLVRRNQRGASATKSSPEMSALILAVVVALVATPLFVVLKVTFDESAADAMPPQALLPPAAYVWFHLGLFVAFAYLAERPAFLVGAAAASAASLAFLVLNANAGQANECALVTVPPMLALWSVPLFGPRFRRGVAAWASSPLALVFHFPLLYSATHGTWSDGAVGAASAGCGLLAMVTLVVARRGEAAPEATVTAIVGGIALLFLTSAVPILLSNEWLTVAWTLEAAALAWLWRGARHRGLLIAVGVLASATLIRLVLNPAVLDYHPRSGVPILNWWLYTYGVSALALLAAWKLLDGSSPEGKRSVRDLCAFAGGLLLFLLLNIEIADYYSPGVEVTFEFSGGFQKDMTYTLAWGIFALSLLALGMAMRSKTLRIWAIGLVCVTVAKGALHDLWALGSLYRVGAIVGLAMTLLAVSYLTQRFVLRREAK
jgi:uncharacterized membrane protein